MRAWIACPDPRCVDGVYAGRDGGILLVATCTTCDGRLWIRDRRQAELRLRPVALALLIALAVVVASAGFLVGRLS